MTYVPKFQNDSYATNDALSMTVHEQYGKLVRNFCKAVTAIQRDQIGIADHLIEHLKDDREKLDGMNLPKKELMLETRQLLSDYRDVIESKNTLAQQMLHACNSALGALAAVGQSFADNTTDYFACYHHDIVQEIEQLNELLAEPEAIAEDLPPATDESVPQAAIQAVADSIEPSGSNLDDILGRLTVLLREAGVDDLDALLVNDPETFAKQQAIGNG